MTTLPLLRGARRFALLFLISAGATLAACTTTQDAAITLDGKWLGRPVNEFFSRYGPPQTTKKLKSGNTLYTWAHAEDVAPRGGGGGATRAACEVQIVTMPTGYIVQFGIAEDTVGYWQYSRCNEIFE